MANQFLARALGLRAGETPFPWQERLHARLLRGDIPRAVDVPTGLGKTSVIALWLLARATAPLPRRLVYVVDRRAVVDQATAVAESLRAWLESDDEARRELRLTGPLAISTLRGQHLDNKRWLEDPAAPAIVIGTVDMVGSRLLFGGYGVSRRMRPFHAGLLGVDTLVVLDEAHLVPPFERLLESVGAPEFAPAPERRAAVPAFRILPLSATGRARTDDVLSLDSSDAEHPIARRRLSAVKALTFHTPAADEKLPEALARNALSLSRDDGPRRCIVFCDSRENALSVVKAIEVTAPSERKAQRTPPRVELFVGGRRAHERQDAAARLEALGFLAGTDEPPTAPTILVATSAAEVGVDLDAHDMVCDLVAWERMVQRLGRVNRRGRYAARVVVITPAPSKEELAATAKPVEDRNEKETLLGERHLRREAAGALIAMLPEANGAYDASPRALVELKSRGEREESVRDLLARASTPEPLRPALSRAVVESWSMTSLIEHAGRPVVQPWLRGWVEQEAETALVFRRLLPVRPDGQPLAERDVGRFFEATPPHASEVLETQTPRVVSWLLARAAAFSKTHRDSMRAAVAFVLDSAGELERTVRVSDLTPNRDSERKVRDTLHRQVVGRTLVVDVALGGLSQGLLDEDATEPPASADTDEAWSREVGFRVDLIPSTANAVEEPNWKERLRVVVERSAAGDPLRELRVCRFDDDAAIEDDRSEGNLQTLAEHQSWTEERARAIAERVHLPAPLARALSVAARLHDEGKRAKRWQRAFSAPSDDFYAKTPGPLRVALLDGYRHEFGSLPHVERDAEVAALPADLRDLALHLVASHHGFARPTIPVRGCDDAPPSLLAARAREVALRFARLERAWGPWGLAWLEALLRAADQQASRANDRRERKAGG